MRVCNGYCIDASLQPNFRFATLFFLLLVLLLFSSSLNSSVPFFLLSFFGPYFFDSFHFALCCILVVSFGNRQNVCARTYSKRNATNSERCNDHTIDMHREIESTHKQQQQQRLRLHIASTMTTTATTQAEDTHCVCVSAMTSNDETTHALALTMMISR